MKALAFSAAALVASLALSACKDEASFATVEEARGTARENALFNGQRFRATSPKFSDWDLVSRGDSTQSATCPQGDGWASIDLISPNKAMTVQLKCSTVSANIGCLESADFKSKPYATQDGKCANVAEVPHPLPKIAK